MEASNLALFWAGALAVSVLLYTILDGFDLGVGILFGTVADEPTKGRMIATIAPFWDGNETWLIIVGAGLFATFPAVYAIFLEAFYLPVLLLLLGLIFRGVAFEYRVRSTHMRPTWDRGFFLGSLVAAFVQGAAVGAMMQGIPVRDNQFAGDSLFWLAPFPVLTGLGLVLGYTLLGACWLVLKSDGDLRDWAYRRIPWLAGGVMLILCAAFGLFFDGSILARSHLLERPWGFVFPVAGLAALAGVFFSARWRHDALPFALAVAFFFASFVSLGVMVWPYMSPYAVTVASAAAPEASLQFLFYGGVVVLPVVAVYTLGVYRVFRGKVS